MTDPRACILIAEDDAETRATLADLLRADGHRVEEAASGPDLARAIAMRLETRREVPLDLILADVRMPGLTGLEVLDALRAVEWSTPVVVMTAFANEDVRAEALRLGAIAVLDKPFGIEELRAVVRRALAAGRVSGSAAASRRR